jgi:carbon storage regulator CsrA
VLILTRRVEVSPGVVISVNGVDIRIVVIGIERDRVKLGFDAPDSVKILREELLTEPIREKKRA